MTRFWVGAIAFVGLLVLPGAGGKSDQAAGSRAVAGVASLEFLDVGQGDAILIRSPEGKTALVDAGPSNRIVDLLQAKGIKTLDLVVISHHHHDHYGGMAEVVRRFHPRYFLDARSPHSTPNYVALLKRIGADGVAVIQAGPRIRRIGLGPVTLTILPQGPLDKQDENNNSVGIRLDFGEFSALLPGDAEGHERHWWMLHYPELCRDVDVLKLAHHGSRNGTNLAWLGLTRPSLAIASLGSGNEFSHPHPETLALLGSLEIPLVRTDESGSIKIRSDGETWWLEHSNPRSRAPPSEERFSPCGLIRLNSCSEHELQALPGIGAVLAARIIARRPYRSIDELASIPALGKKRLERIRPFLVID